MMIPPPLPLQRGKKRRLEPPTKTGSNFFGEKRNETVPVLCMFLFGADNG